MKNDYEIRGCITAIFLKRKNGLVLETIIDSADFEEVNSHKGTWHATYNPRTKSYYAFCNFRKAGKIEKLFMHRFLLKTEKEKVSDHINGITLDNRKASNLRVLTVGENNQNLIKLRSNNKSGHRGVNWRKDKLKWEARITINKIKKRLGYFDSVEDAVIVVKEARAKYMPYSQEALAN